MAHVQASQTKPVVIDRREIGSKLDRPDLHLPQSLRESVRQSVEALLDAYEQDSENRCEPNLRSFENMVNFLSHPYRTSWIDPGIALNPEGIFSLVWEDGPHRWLLDFPPEERVESVYLRRDSEGKVYRVAGNDQHIMNFVPPPFPIPKR